MKVTSSQNMAKNDFISIGLTDSAPALTSQELAALELRAGFTVIKSASGSVGIDFASVNGRLRDCETLPLDNPRKDYEYERTVERTSQQQKASGRSAGLSAGGHGVAPSLSGDVSKRREASVRTVEKSTVREAVFAEKQFGSHFEWHYRAAGVVLLDGVERTRFIVKRPSGGGRPCGTISADILRHLRVLDSKGNDVGKLTRWVVLSRTRRDYRVHDVKLEFDL